MQNKLIYAASESCPDLWYLTGFAAPDPFLYFQTCDRRVAAVSCLELGRAQKECHPQVTVADVQRLPEFFGMEDKNEPGEHWFVKLVRTVCRGTGVWEWEVPASFPLALGDLLRNNGVSLTTATSLAPERQVKSPREIEAVRAAERLAEAGLAQADGMLRQSTVDAEGFLVLGGHILTAEELRGEVDAAIARKGGLAQGTITAPGVQGADPHQSGTGPLRANEPIVMDIFPRDQHTGYFGDLTRTRVKGRAPDIVKKAYLTVLEAQEHALKSLRPGVTGKEVHEAAARYFEEQGFPRQRDEATGLYRGFFHGLGHSVGLEIHEGPHLSPGNPTPLVAGNVVTVEPGLYDPTWGGIRIEDTVAITPDGIDNLAVAPKFLEIE